MIAQFIGDVVTNAVDFVFKLVIEQVADHRHAAAHPLATSTKFRMIELGHGAIAILDGNQHVGRSVSRNAVTHGQILNELDSGIREHRH